MKNLSKRSIAKLLSVVCTMMLTVICAASFGFKPNSAHAACSHRFNGSYNIERYATCTTNGSKVGRCTKCGTVVARQTIYATGHKWTGWTVTKNATCTTNGTKTRYCTKCGRREYATIYAYGHTSNGSYTVTKNPTCTTAGTRVLKCTRAGCNAVLNTQSIPATGHNWVDSKVLKNRSCTEKGVVVQSCTKCHTTKNVELAPLGHTTNGSYTVTKQPTCTATGTRVLRCTRSGCKTILNSQTIPALGHNRATRYVNGIKEEYCTRCKTVLSNTAKDLKAAYKKTYECSDAEAEKKVQEALKYLNQMANLGNPSAKDSAMCKLLTEINGLGDFSLGNDKLEKCADACEYILLVNDLKTVFNNDSSNIEKFESTLSALSTACSKVPMGEQTLGKALDTMSDNLIDSLRQAETSINYANMVDFAADSQRDSSVNTIIIDGKETHVADLTVVELASNYDTVEAILRSHYDTIHESEGKTNYVDSTARDNFVQTFVRTKIAEEEDGYNDFAQYVTYCVEH